MAIIGNKGSGKSALADIIALVGNSKQSHHFSFLKKNRFRGKLGVPAKHFTAKLTWGDEQVLDKNLNVDPEAESVEFVKYIPQGHFEELCNDHVEGKSNSFEEELRAVIFSHADEATRLGAHNFKQLIEQQESSLRSHFDSLRSLLHKLNRQLAYVEGQMSDVNRKAIYEHLAQKKRLLEEHMKVQPKEVCEPTTETSAEQQRITEELANIHKQIEEISAKQEENKEELTRFALKRKACLDIREGVEVVERSISQFKSDNSVNAVTLAIDLDRFISLKIEEQVLSEIDNETSTQIAAIKANNETLGINKNALILRRNSLNTMLNGPQKAYQQYLELLSSWEEKQAGIVGSRDLPDTVEGLEYQLEQWDQLPVERDDLHTQRIEITGQIFDILNEQRISREALFKPVQELIQSNALIRNEYKLQFQAEIKSNPDTIYDRLFLMVKQTAGEFRGESESLSVIRELMEKYDISKKSSLINFVQELHQKLEEASKLPGIQSSLKKDRSATEVYDFIFGLEYLKPQYTLMFQDAQIEQLSPGQRGALLLIFYLLVDKDSNPIILDQPEENLDNETIVSLLVPVLTEAKQKRQIIMVTHNPNLAVVCDAEQIIHCEFSRSDSNNISYISGAIECSIINTKAVDVLEGTMIAFDNRKIKYM